MVNWKQGQSSVTTGSFCSIIIKHAAKIDVSNKENHSRQENISDLGIKTLLT